MKQPNWTRILTILLVILTGYAVLYVTALVLSHFKHALFIFFMAGMLAYILTPLVNRLEVVVRLRWVAVLSSYVLVAVLLFALGILLVTPFIQQSQSLIDNLRTPSASTIAAVQRVRVDTTTLLHHLQGQKHRYLAGSTTTT